MSFTLIGKHEKDSRANRDGYVTALEEMMQADRNVVHIDCDLYNCINTAKLEKEFPGQCFNAGIAEADAMGIAAGMTAAGKTAFVHSFGCFASRRAFDQAYLACGYSLVPVHVIGSDPGVTAALNGGTHMPFEDMGLMRCIPEVTILEPTDSVMLADLLRQTKDLHGVFYIRLSRKKVQKIFADGSTFTIGKAAKLRDGNDVTIFATGISVADALRASDMLAAEHISAGVTNLFTIKPIDREAIAEAAQSTGAIVTAENHNVIGGLGSAVAEVLAETTPCALERVGVHDRFGEVGDVEYLKKTLHLTAEDIVLAAKRAIARKGK